MSFRVQLALVRDLRPASIRRCRLDHRTACAGGSNRSPPVLHDGASRAERYHRRVATKDDDEPAAAGPIATNRPAPRRRRADGEKTRRKILDAAVACILDTGYYHASTNQIASRAGVTWGALQNLFGSREALLIEVLNERWGLLQRAVADADIVGETVEDRLHEVLTVLASYYGQPEHLAQIQILLDLSRNPKTSAETRDAVAAHGRELVRAWKPLFGKALGEAAEDDELVRYAFSALRGYLVGHVVSSSIAETADDGTQRELLVHGVAAAVRSAAQRRGVGVG